MKREREEEKAKGKFQRSVRLRLATTSGNYFFKTKERNLMLSMTSIQSKNCNQTFKTPPNISNAARAPCKHSFRARPSTPPLQRNVYSTIRISSFVYINCDPDSLQGSVITLVKKRSALKSAYLKAAVPLLDLLFREIRVL